MIWHRTDPARPANDPAWAREAEAQAGPALRRAMQLRQRTREAARLSEADPTPEHHREMFRLNKLADAAAKELSPWEVSVLHEWSFATAGDQVRAMVGLPPLEGRALD